MHERGLKMMLAVVVVTISLLGLAGVAQAGYWEDLPSSLLYKYGLTEDQVAQVSDGFPSGLWLPNKLVSRAQFVKMATVAFNVPEADPMVPTYDDVDEDNYHYSYIEGATSAGLLAGMGNDGLFHPGASITRQEAAAIVAREIAAANGYNLDQLYANSAVTILAKFKDGSSVSRDIQSAVAFAVERGILNGNQEGWLSPRANLTRLQGAAIIIRAGAPQITSISPASGPATGGNKVIITGVGFANLWELGSVKFGLANAVSYTIDSATQITAVVPAGTAGTSVEVSVSSAAGIFTTVGAQRYTYGYDTPTVSSVTPGSGPAAGGNAVAINGSLLTGITAVYFGSTPASFTIVSATQISAVAPPGSSGETVYVTVVGPAGSSAATSASRYTYGVPVLISVDPAAGPAEGGNTVVITGAGLAGAIDVLFGSRGATRITLNSPTQITVIAPSGADATTVDITIVGQGGSSVAVPAGRYTYGAPLVTSISPDAGSSDGYDSVVINGIGFTGLSGASAVRFGARNAVSYEVISDTQIIAQAPPGTAGTSVNVCVTNPAGTSPATVQYMYYGG